MLFTDSPAFLRASDAQVTSKMASRFPAVTNKEISQIIKQAVPEIRDLSFIRGGGRAGANGGRVIKFYVGKKGRVTKNLSWALGRAIPFLANIAVRLK